jgi:formylglycine-generating enzyme required for sulfatase activity
MVCQNNKQTRAKKIVAQKKKGAATPFVGDRAGQKREDNLLQMKLAWCPPGDFMMGDPKHEDAAIIVKQVQVTLTKGFWLGETPVTQGQWQKLMGTPPWSKDCQLAKLKKEALEFFEEQRESGWLDEDDLEDLDEEQLLDGDHFLNFVKQSSDYPAVYVTWDDVMKFCQKLTEEERCAGRLPMDWRYTMPTEAQWEYACRAGTTTQFSFGDDASGLPEYGWFAGNASDVGEKYAHRVGQKRPNPWGLYDMHGNVLERCRDRYTEQLPGGTDPEVAVEGRRGSETTVALGGSWCCAAEFCVSATCRCGFAPWMRSIVVGFRVALEQSGK